MKNNHNLETTIQIDKLQTLIYTKCKIRPLEDLEGRIMSISISKYGLEYNVRYYIDGEQKEREFLNEEIKIERNKYENEDKCNVGT